MANLVTRYIEKMVLGLTNASPSWRSGAGDPNGAVGGIVGDGYLSTNGNFYRCTVAHATAATWAPVGGSADMWPQPSSLFTAVPTTGWTDANVPVVTAITNPIAGMQITRLGNGGGGDLHVRRVRSIGGATTFTSRMRVSTPLKGFGGIYLILRESSTNRLCGIGIQSDNGDPGLCRFHCAKWASDTGSGSDLGTSVRCDPNIPVWGRLTLTGGNIVASYSYDGYNFFSPLLSVAQTNPFITAPDQYGLSVDVVGGDVTLQVGGIWDSLLAA